MSHVRLPQIKKRSSHGDKADASLAHPERSFRPPAIVSTRVPAPGRFQLARSVEQQPTVFPRRARTPTVDLRLASGPEQHQRGRRE